MRQNGWNVFLQHKLPDVKKDTIPLILKIKSVLKFEITRVKLLGLLPITV